MKLKKFIAAFLSMVMLMSFVPMTSQAVLVNPDAGKAKMVLKFLKDGGDEDFPFEEITEKDVKAKVNATDDAGKRFYVGIFLENFSNIKEVQEFDAATQQQGLNNIACALAFNSTYLQIEPTVTSGSTRYFNTKWNTRMDYPTSIKNKEGALYQFKRASAKEQTSTTADQTNGFDKEVGVDMPSDLVESSEFVAYSGGDDTYLCIVEFQFTDAAKTAPEGTQIVGFSTFAAHNTMTFGVDRTTYQDSSSVQGQTGKTQYIRDVVEYDTSNVEHVFPYVYNVDFYNDATSANTETNQVGTTLTVDDGSTVEEASVPANNQFTPLNTSDFFKELRYFVVTDTKTEAADDDPIFYPDKGENNPEGYTPTKITGNTKVYATYETGYKVDFKANYEGATTEGVTKYIDKNAADKKIPTDMLDEVKTTFTRDGWTISGWSTDAAGNDVFDVEQDEITADTTLYAQWTQNINITFDPNYIQDNGSAADTTTIVRKPNEAIGTEGVPADPSRDNYDFKGWNTDGSAATGTTAADLAAVVPTEDTTYYAIWELKDTVPEEEQSTVTFHSAYGDPEQTQTITVKTGDKITEAQAPAFTRNYYTLEGWYESADVTDTTKIVFPHAVGTDGGEKVEEDLYAHWTHDPDDEDKVTVTFKAPDAKETNSTGGKEWTVELHTGDAVGAAAPTVTRDDYGFNQWVLEDNTSTAFDVTAAVNTDTVVVATWTENITISFDINSGTGDVQDLKGAPTAEYTGPASTPTKDGYKLIGWNTKRNGSGTYAEVSTETAKVTFNDVYTAAGGADSHATVYAQWAAVPDDTDPDDVKDDEPPVEPSEDSVRVHFVANIGNNEADPATVTPAYKYVKVDDIIGIDATEGNSNLPSISERQHYKFVKWDTKANGSGTEITETTPISESLGFTATAGGGKELTVYAIWDLDTEKVTDPNEKSTVNYIKNFDNRVEDTTGDNLLDRKTVFRGDSVVALPDAPAHEGFTFLGWSTDRLAKKITTSNEFTGDTKVTEASVNVYAIWKQPLYIKVKDSTVPYTGDPQAVEFEVYRVTPKADGSIDTSDETAMEKLPDEEIADNFTVTYTTGGVDSTDAPSNAAVYDLSIVTKGDYAAMGRQVESVSNEQYTITPTEVSVAIADGTQKVKKAANAADQEYIQYTLTPNVESGIKYKLWTDSTETGTPGVIDDGELGTLEEKPTEVGKYVAVISLANTNYIISSITQGTVYDETTYPGAKTGENIMFEIELGNPAINAPEINSLKPEKGEDGNPTGNTVVAEANLPLTGNDYTTPKDFDTSEEPENPEYFVRVKDTDADEVQFVITPQNPAAKVEVTAPTEGVTITPDTTDPEHPKYTITVPLTNKGATPNDVVIKTSVGEGEGVPTIDYTFHVQALAAIEITLNYGNSPYGLIKSSLDESVWDNALTAFNTANTFRGLDAQYVPTGANTISNFSVEAWIGEYDPDSLSEEQLAELNARMADPSVNMDRNDKALFVYNESSFKDTGFTVKDSFGNIVSEDDIKANLVRTITVQQMSGANIQGLIGDYTNKDVTIDNKESNCLIENITEPGQSIVPGIYTMTYKYTDPTTGKEGEVKRPIVVVWELGDADMTADVNVSDPGAVYTVVNGLVKVVTNETPEDKKPFRTQVQNLFLFRIADADTSGQVNVSDPGAVYNIVNGIVNKRIYKESK